MVAAENEWRATNCPGYEMVNCAEIQDESCGCDGAWTCDDIEAIALDMISSMDTNGDGYINLGEDYEGDHV
jgi:hypothetical protein